MRFIAYLLLRFCYPERKTIIFRSLNITIEYLDQNNYKSIVYMEHASYRLSYNNKALKIFFRIIDRMVYAKQVYTFRNYE